MRDTRVIQCAKAITKIQDTFSGGGIRWSRLIHILIGRNIHGHLNFNRTTTFPTMTSEPIVYAHVT